MTDEPDAPEETPGVVVETNPGRVEGYPTRFALIEGGIVKAIEHIVVPEGLTVGQNFLVGLDLIRTDDENAVEGASYSAGVFTPPEPEVLPKKTVFSYREFVGLFTVDERNALFEARRSNTQVDQFITNASSGPIDISDPEAIADVNAIAQAGIITPTRAEQILAGDPVT